MQPYAAALADLRDARRLAKPRLAKPTPSMAQVGVSGIALSASTANSAAKRWPAAVGWTSSQNRNWSWSDGSFAQSVPMLGLVKPPVQHGSFTFVKPKWDGSALISSSRSYVSRVKTFSPSLLSPARPFSTSALNDAAKSLAFI